MLIAPYNLDDFEFNIGPDRVVVIAPAADPGASDTFPAIFNDRFVNTLPGRDVIIGAITGFVTADDVDFTGFSNDGVLQTSLGNDRVVGAVLFERAFDGDFSSDNQGINGGGLISTGFGDDDIVGRVRLIDTGDAEPALFGFAVRGVLLKTGLGDDEVSGTIRLVSAGGATVSGRAINDVIYLAGPGNDGVHGTIIARSPEFLAITADGLTAVRSNTLDMGSGDDTLSAHATVSGLLTDAEIGTVDIGAIRSTNALLGGGDDDVVAKVVVDSDRDGFGRASVAADGIRSSVFGLGAGADKFDISVDVENASSVVANGLRSTTIANGLFGPKTIDIDVNAKGQGAGVDANGLLASTVETGNDDDTVAVDVSATSGSGFATILGAGMLGGSIATGHGTDVVSFTSTATFTEFIGGFFVDAAAFGVFDASITGGRGVDQVLATASALGPRAFAYGIWDSTVHVGDDGGRLHVGDDDLVQAKATATGPGAAAFGLADTDVSTGRGADVVIGESEATSSSDLGYAIALGLSGGPSNSIEMGRGSDEVRGIATAVADVEAEEPFASAAGITGSSPDPDDFFISTGPGADKVVGTGMATAMNPDTRGYGIAGTTIELGSGGDKVVARGSTVGLFEVRIDGGPGWDVFDIQNGTGFLDGGTGTDTLILFGERSDYEFDRVDRNTRVITDRATDGDVTNLTATNFEILLFRPETTDFDDAFIA